MGNIVELSVPAVNAQSLVSSAGTFSWASPGNWQGGVAPDVRGDAAAFAALSGSGSATIVLAGSDTLSGLSFSALGGGGYVLSRTDSVSSLQLANGGSPVPVSIAAGAAAIAVPVVFGDNVNISTGSGAVATISGPISESGGSHSLTLSGSGELTLSGTDTYSGGTTLNGGALEIAAASALPGSGLVSISGGGRLVLGSGAGIGALLAASSPVSSGAVALSAAASVPGTIGGYESGSANMATLGDAPPLSQGGGEAPSAARPRPCRNRGPLPCWRLGF